MSMNHVRRALTLFLSLVLALGLAACGPGGPDMPMEIQIDGDAIVLGQTTLPDLARLGWKAKLTGAQREIRAKAKFVGFHYRLERTDGSGVQFWASVYVPFQGNVSGGSADISQEQAIAGEEGVLYRVEARKDAAGDCDIFYNGVNLQDMTCARARRWGAVKDEAQSRTTYTLEAARGSLSFEQSDTDSGLGGLTITMSAAAFEKLRE